MSDYEEPAAKISKVEVAPIERFEEMDEGQEEWLSEEILTDDDYNSQGNQNQVDSIINRSQYDSTPSIPDADEAQDETQDTQMDSNEQPIDNIHNSNQTELPEELGAFLIRKTDGKVLDTADTKKEESEIDESTKQSDDDGHDTDELLRMLGEDNSQNKEEKEEEKKQHESSDDDDDGYIFEGAKISRLKVAKNAIFKKFPTKAVPEESERDTDASSDEGVTMKRMFGVTKKEARNVASKSTTKSGINALKTITKKIVTVQKPEGKAPTTSTPLPKPLSRKVRPETESRKVVRLEPDDSRKFNKRERDEKRKVFRVETDEFGKVIKEVDEKRRVRLEPDDLPRVIRVESDEKRKVVKSYLDEKRKVRGHDEFFKIARQEPLEKRKVVKLEPDEKRKVVRIETDEKKKVVRFGPDKVRKVARPESVERRKVIKPEHDEIIDEEEFMEGNHDQFDLEEEFDSDAEGSRQRIMRPEQMDEEMLTDGDTSQSDDESLYDELPSSDSDELHEWFTLDIRSERAGDYLPLLGAKAQQILLAEKQRVSSRLSTLKESVTALNDSSAQQADMLRRATLQLAELDAALKA